MLLIPGVRTSRAERRGTAVRGLVVGALLLVLVLEV